MKYFRTLILLALCTFAVNTVAGQVRKPDKPSISVSNTLKHSATFAEVLLRRTELESDLEESLVTYTEEYPKVKEARYELSVLKKELAKLNSVKAGETGKLTSALGKLIVRKATVETDYWVLSSRFTAEDPRVRRAKKKLEIFQRALNEIL